MQPMKVVVSYSDFHAFVTHTVELLYIWQPEDTGRLYIDKSGRMRTVCLCDEYAKILPPDVRGSDGGHLLSLLWAFMIYVECLGHQCAGRRKRSANYSIISERFHIERLTERPSCAPENFIKAGTVDHLHGQTARNVYYGQIVYTASEKENSAVVRQSLTWTYRSDKG